MSQEQVKEQIMEIKKALEELQEQVPIELQETLEKAITCLSQLEDLVIGEGELIVRKNYGSYKIVIDTPFFARYYDIDGQKDLKTIYETIKAEVLREIGNLMRHVIVELKYAFAKYMDVLTTYRHLYEEINELKQQIDP